MRRIWYSVIRNAPKGGGSVFTVIAGLWASAKPDAFAGYVRWKWDTLDVAHTGAFVAFTVIGYGLLVWVTRDWNKSDRSAYVEGLQELLINHTNYNSALEQCTTDQNLEVLAYGWYPMRETSINWLREMMGEAAVAKFISGNTAMSFNSWTGLHSQTAIDKRDNLLRDMYLRKQNIEQLMASGHWDSPVSLAKRRWHARKKRSREWIKSKIFMSKP